MSWTVSSGATMGRWYRRSSMEPGSARQDFVLQHMSADFTVEVEGRTDAELVAEREVRVRVLPRAEAFAIPDLIRTKINLLPEGIEHIRGSKSSAWTCTRTVARTWRGQARWVRSAWWGTKARAASTSGYAWPSGPKRLMRSRVLAKGTFDRPALALNSMNTCC
jgi:hypothetical protein